MNPPITLRAATPADIPFLLSLRKLTMTAHLQRAGVPTDDDTHHRRIQANFEDAKIICDGAESIGLLKLSRATDEWHLHQIQVLPAHQGKGIGNALLRDVLAEATCAGVPVSLSVLQGNPARHLYEHLGFRVITETPIDAKLTWHP
ncbi:GNAT family N-acetyltransferase [Burkholderia ubonensis]|uniref:GNAT family N-acetyltransferase n=1 Tax=Burkholderia ubonensis subsp. mesacidophila TaxID=265293 RepID=A0A2A4FNC5_9BURK|nr:GNAT family N-acetyltransferase [Burkholderia ubonensis]PCE34182.1 GNAT family N-acetyltransferase [Burkholderia ubonensis subsp. mesacidophila]